MIFTLPALEAIRTGRVTLAFRRWSTARVKPGSRIRHQLGVVEIVSVDPVDTVSEADARAAGYAGAADLVADVDTRSRGGALYRIGVRYGGPDPRLVLREQADLSGSDVAEIAARLARLDGADPWTRTYLRLIDANPAVVARELAARVGIERDRFKIRVRRLKDLGLTESLEVGYRLSARGRAFLAADAQAAASAG